MKAILLLGFLAVVPALTDSVWGARPVVPPPDQAAALARADADERVSDAAAREWPWLCAARS
jgi:hypothetical protein